MNSLPSLLSSHKSPALPTESRISELLAGDLNTICHRIPKTACGKTLKRDFAFTIASEISRIDAKLKRISDQLGSQGFQENRASISESIDEAFEELKNGFAFSMSLEHGDAQGVYEFILDGKVSQPFQEKNIASIAKKGYYACLQAVLNSGPISQEYLGEAVVSAAEYGHVDCLQILLKNLLKASSDKALSENLGEALQGAAKHGHVDCLRILLKHTISDEDRDWAFQLAAEYGHVDCLKYLLDSCKSISAKCLEEALHLAVIKSHVYCLQILLRKQAEMLYHNQ
jgi:hypothetical protein